MTWSTSTSAAEGWRDDRLFRKEFVRTYYPIDVSGERRTAIAWTTSASACAVLEMVNDGTLPARGFVKQEEIPLDAFLKTPTGRLFGDVAG